MTPFTESTAASAGRLGGMKRTKAQRRALRLGGKARKGSGYVPDDPEPVLDVLAMAKGITVQARRGGSPQDQRSVRSLARHIGVNDATVRRWFLGAGWPRPSQVARLRAWTQTLVAQDAR